MVAEGLTVLRGGTRLLDRVSLRIATGEFLAVLGPNGAGKSTLLQTLPALIACTGGLTVLGQRLDRLSALKRNALRRRIGYVPQLQSRPSPVLPLCVREVVELGRYPHRRQPSRHEADIVQQAMQAAAVDHLQHRVLNTLSGGEKARVHLARALAQVWDWGQKLVFWEKYMTKGKIPLRSKTISMVESTDAWIIRRPARSLFGKMVI